MKRIPIAIVGVGNCASSLVQGIHYYRRVFETGEEIVGLAHTTIGGYAPGDIAVVAAVDVDARKVGLPLREALFAPPNNSQVFYDDFSSDVSVVMGNPLDGVAGHMKDYPDDESFRTADDPAASREDICRLLSESGAEILMNYLPVGSRDATAFYAECCLETGVSLINCIPVFIVSDEQWAGRFAERGIPCVGDDIKAQVGATITHRVLTKMMNDRGATIDRTYQLNWAGNTDFLNMLERSRLGNKKISKTEAVQCEMGEPLSAENIHIGPAEYVPWQKDNKVCALRIEGRGFGGVPFDIDLRLSVQDSPNSGGETIDAIRVCKLARERGLAGPLEAVSAYTMKHPPVQYTDSVAAKMLDDFITGEGDA